MPFFSFSLPKPGKGGKLYTSSVRALRFLFIILCLTYCCSSGLKQNHFLQFHVAAKRLLTLPSVPEEKERHHSVPAMVHAQRRREGHKHKLSLARRSTRWTLIADNVKVLTPVNLSRNQRFLRISCKLVNCKLKFLFSFARNFVMLQLRIVPILIIWQFSRRNIQLSIQIRLTKWPSSVLSFFMFLFNFLPKKMNNANTILCKRGRKQLRYGRRL